MKTAFLLGSSLSLSYAELESVFFGKSIEKKANMVFIDASYGEVMSKFYHLGGTIRAFEILKWEVEIFDILPAIKQYVAAHAKNGKKMKIAFFAQHPAFAKRNFMKWMQEMKTFSKNATISLRIVNRGDQNLDTNAVDKEKLLENGNAEFAIAEYGDRFVLMRTIAVQEVWKFITRDMKKPMRDMQVGMLPPKLARMMINLSRKNGELPYFIYDAFCGTGTVLLEAMDLQVVALGSDFSEKMVAATQKNTKWFADLTHQSLPIVFQKDATDSFSAHEMKVFRDTKSWGALVGEGYLGHIYTSPLSDDAIKKERAFLFPLYKAFLKNTLQNDTIDTLVFAFPFWKTQKGKYSFVQELFEHNKDWKKTKTLRYLRDEQVVGREIVVASRVF